MKKLLTFILSICLLTSLIGCSDDTLTTTTTKNITIADVLDKMCGSNANYTKTTIEEYDSYNLVTEELRKANVYYTKEYKIYTETSIQEIISETYVSYANDEISTYTKDVTLEYSWSKTVIDDEREDKTEVILVKTDFVFNNGVYEFISDEYVQLFGDIEISLGATLTSSYVMIDGSKMDGFGTTIVTLPLEVEDTEQEEV